ncbi:chemotaxis protein CheW [Haliea atlantica]
MPAALDALASLRERWRASATPVPVVAPVPTPWRGVRVRLAETWQLFPQAALDAVIPCPAVSRIPGTRPFVMGVASWQGGLIPVLSGECLFGLADAPGPARGYALVVRRRGFHFALTTAELRGPLTLAEEAFTESIPPTAPRAEWCSGSVEFGGQVLAVVDIDRLLSDPRLSDTVLARPCSEESLS